jgi:hypothetical protein
LLAFRGGDGCLGRLELPKQGGEGAHLGGFPVADELGEALDAGPLKPDHLVPGEQSHALITTGPYRLTRNPMYAGLAVAYVGDAIAIPEIWALVFLPLVLAYVNWSVIPVEEASLNGVPGYDDYRAKVRRWI